MSELFELNMMQWPDFEAPQGATNITFHREVDITSGK